MYYAKVKQMIGSVVLLAIAGLALQPSIALASDEPELPAECSSIQVEAGNKVSFHVTLGAYRFTDGMAAVGCLSLLLRRCLRKKITSVKSAHTMWVRNGKVRVAVRWRVDEFPAPDVSRTRQRFPGCCFRDSIRLDRASLVRSRSFNASIQPEETLQLSLART